MQRAAGANQHRAEHGSARRGRRNALTDPRLVRSTGHVMALDFDPTVVGIASQPFWLFWPADEGGRRSRMHRTTSFAEWTDRRWWSTVARRIAASHGTRQFETTRRACAMVGWELSAAWRT